SFSGSLDNFPGKFFNVISQDRDVQLFVQFLSETLAKSDNLPGNRFQFPSSVLRNRNNFSWHQSTFASFRSFSTNSLADSSGLPVSSSVFFFFSGNDSF